MFSNDPKGLGTPSRKSWLLYLFRLLLVCLGLFAWYASQALIGQRAPTGNIGDGLFDLLEPWHRFLSENPGWSSALLVVSSAGIDGIGIFLLVRSIIGPTIRPFVGLLIIFQLRQLCQAVSVLPVPPGMIWYDPGFPSLLVTYSVSNDFFFSGHTAIAVYGAVELSKLGKPWLTVAGIALAVFEGVAIMTLRAHYTMDIFAAVVTALYVGILADWLAPYCDRWLKRVAAWGSGPQATDLDE